MTVFDSLTLKDDAFGNSGQQPHADLKLVGTCTASTIALMSQSTSPVRGSNEVFVDDLGMFLGFVLSRPGP